MHGAFAHVCALADDDAALRFDEPEVQQARRDALAWWIPLLGDALVCLSTFAIDASRCAGAITVARDPGYFQDDPFTRLFPGRVSRPTSSPRCRCRPGRSSNDTPAPPGPREHSDDEAPQPSGDTGPVISEENVEIVMRIYDAFNRGDGATVAEAADAAVSIEDHGVIDGKTYHGRRGVKEFLAFQGESFGGSAPGVSRT